MAIDRSRTPLLVLLLAAIAMATGLVLADGQDLLHRQERGSAVLNPGADGQGEWRLAQIMQYMARAQDQSEPDFVIVAPADVYFQTTIDQEQTEGSVLTSSGHTLAWLLWTALPTGLVAVAVLALLATALVAALRRRGGDRALRTAGWVAVIGGLPGAALESAARWWTHGFDYTPSVNRWLLALMLMFVGCAVLAVRAALLRIGALRTELDGVI